MLVTASVCLAGDQKQRSTMTTLPWVGVKHIRLDHTQTGRSISRCPIETAQTANAATPIVKRVREPVFWPLPKTWIDPNYSNEGLALFP
jgi:hypothetical protein